MKKRWIGWAVWLLLAACLYFFENGTGTRIILLCSLLLPLIPALRSAFFGADQTGARNRGHRHRGRPRRRAPPRPERPPGRTDGGDSAWRVCWIFRWSGFFPD